MCWHKWSRWEQFKQKMFRLDKRTLAETPYVERKQKRECLKCGKVQEEIIY